MGSGPRTKLCPTPAVAVGVDSGMQTIGDTLQTYQANIETLFSRIVCLSGGKFFVLNLVTQNIECTLRDVANQILFALLPDGDLAGVRRATVVQNIEIYDTTTGVRSRTIHVVQP